MPRPPLKSPVQQGRSVGTDHGIAVAITAVDDEEHVWRFQHDLEAAAKSNRRIRGQQPRMSQCHQGSRRRKRRKKAVRRLRGKVSRRRQQPAERGTLDAPGTNVGPKAGLTGVATDGRRDGERGSYTVGWRRGGKNGELSLREHP